MLAAATPFGLYLSRDFGGSFSLSSGSEPYSNFVTAIVQDPDQPGRLFIGSADNGVAISTDDGISADTITGNLPIVNPDLTLVPVNDLMVVGNPTVLLAALPNGLFRRTDFSVSGAWSLVLSGNFVNFTRITSTGVETVYAASPTGVSYVCNAFGDVTPCDSGKWTALGSEVADSKAISYSANSNPTSRVSPGGGKTGTGVALMVSGNQAALWSASSGSGAFYSTNGGGSWISAPGANDYALPATTGWSVVQALGVNQNTTGREVVIGNNNLLTQTDPKKGVFLSRDGGATWRNVSGAGSGLEATSKNVSAVIATPTVYSTTDVLVGINGTNDGGVYLSGDAGEHWTQLNAGFDPNNLSISSLVTTSCGGCPVQYYSGSYGGGLYTRTITVTAPPFYTTPATWCAGGGNCCLGATASLQIGGGQAFKICGSNFQNGLVVEFDGVPASGCTQSGGTTITCTASPPHASGASVVRVRNPDTRTGYLPSSAFQFSGGTSRTLNSLKITKASANAALAWTTCNGCSVSAPARIYRAQNAAFSLYLEQYNGGIGGAYTNAGAVTTMQSYFWTVE